MPFTFSHPAIVLPLVYISRKWFSISALVVGSLTPDFEYFFRMKLKSQYSHTLEGLFWFDLPLGLLLLFIFHFVIRDVLIENLPKEIKSRFYSNSKYDWCSYFKNNWLIVLSSIFIGALSHVLWDSFTHKSGYFVELIPTLKNSVFFLGNHVPIYKLLQHCSTFLGGLFIIIAVFKLPKNKNATKRKDSWYWIVLILLTFVFASSKFIIDSIPSVGNIVVVLVSSGLISLTITSAIFKFKNQ